MDPPKLRMKPEDVKATTEHFMPEKSFIHFVIFPEKYKERQKEKQNQKVVRR